MTLITLHHPSPESEKVLATLDKLRGLKPARDYPWMPVSKFTHFFNPKLFPIYDFTVIWKWVLNGAFRNDYRDWCHSQYLNPNGPGERFNLYYMLWSGHIIRQADDNFMGFFSQWFKSQVGNHPDSQNVMDDLHHYYATAFEFVAIGAAALELSDIAL